MKIAGGVVWWRLGEADLGTAFASDWRASGLDFAPPADPSPAEVGRWLSQDVVFALYALALRPRSGFYFVAGSQIENWLRAAALVSKHSPHRFGGLTVLATPSTAASVYVALSEDVRAWVDGAEREAKARLGRRRAETLLAEAAGQLVKIQVYAAVTTNVDDLRARVVSVAASVAPITERTR